MKLRRQIFSYLLVIVFLTIISNLGINYLLTDYSFGVLTNSLRQSYADAVRQRLLNYHSTYGEFTGISLEDIHPRSLSLTLPWPFQNMTRNNAPQIVNLPGGTWHIVIENTEGRVVAGHDWADKRQGSAYALVQDGTWLGCFWLIPRDNSLLFLARTFLIVPLLHRNVWTILLASLIAFGASFYIAHYLLKHISELAAAAKKIAQGEFHHRVTVKTDNELGQLAANFNQMAAQLEDGQRLRRQLQADVIHELRTPLAVCQAALDAVESGSTPWDNRVLISLQNEIGRMQRLVTDLFDLSKSENRQLALYREMLYVQDLLDKIYDSFAEPARHKNVSFTIETEGGIGQEILYVDPDRVVQIFLNLLHNALRFTPENGQISITAFLRNGQAEFVVADNGCGIDEKHLPHIFDRFYRDEDSRSRQTGSTGLGLAIAKEYTLLHGGAISVQSAVGKGTAFKIRIPVEPGCSN